MIAFTHPELEKRYNRVVEVFWSQNWDIWVTSSSRSYEQQKEWYELYLQGKWPNLVANPDRYQGHSPWGWDAWGSMHMVQADGYSHALDIGWNGPYDREAHAIFEQYGIGFPESTEGWHAQWWDPWAGIYPVLVPESPVLTPTPIHKEIDMYAVIAPSDDASQPLKNGVFVTDGISVRYIKSGHDLALLTAAGVPQITATEEQLRAFLTEGGTKVGTGPTTGNYASWW